MPPPDDDDAYEKAKRMMEQSEGKKVIRLDSKREERQAKEQKEKERQAKRREREERLTQPKTFKPLPDDCPVRPLGVAGSNYYFLDAIDQLICKPAEKMGQNGVSDLLKSEDARRWAEANYPRLSMHGNVIGIDKERLNAAWITRCGELSKSGIFDPSGRIRGDGVWQNEHGHLVFHCGDVIYTAARDGKLHESKPTIGDHYIYPKGTAQLRPLPDKVDHAPATELLELLKSWHWKRGELDARLMLGWITLAAVAGALKWRPATWITGDQATGKSTLQELIRGTQGGHRGLIQAADATGAGIWQALKFRSVPVALDEIEADTDNTKRQTIMTLMRISASGDRLKRGGADHEGVEFNAYSAFMFSSINMLPLAPQDMSRLALLELLPLPPDNPRPSLDPQRLAHIGRALRRRVIMAWPMWEDVLRPWRQPLEKAFDRRTADTFGYLLAMADLARHTDVADSDSVAESMDVLLPSLREWKTIAGRDDELMLNRLATTQLEPWDNRRKITIRQLVYWASRRAATPQADEVQNYGTEVTPDRANEALRRHGLTVTRLRGDGAPTVEYLAIAYRHSELDKIFRNTKWQSGGWRQSASRVAGAVSSGKKVRFQGWPEAAVRIPVAALLGDGADDDEV